MSEKIAHEKNVECCASDRLLTLTAQIVSSYVEENEVSMADLPALMATVYQNLARIGSGSAAQQTNREPAVPVRRSVTPEYIICLEDGKKLKMLKRHLKTSYNLTPDQYRERWGLGSDYPMVAPNYAKQRSKLAKQIGLGTSRRTSKRSG
ncbi:MAG: MucR family transcriptional regulator [Alphaproteobacteria bacterium]|nr:MucR family transcriptional regulator [Alphaproteobacteria bacterium]